MNRCLTIIFIFLAISAIGQSSGDIYTKILPYQSDTIQIDNGFVQNESVRIVGYVSNKDFIQLANRIVWLADAPTDSLTVSYRKLAFKTKYYNKNPNIINQVYQKNPFDYTAENRKNRTEYGTLKTRGNVSRGIGFGNAQDIVVNSNLNLRLSGKLANDVDVLAVISDENNPIQPEGNTQQIQDFDQVYITLKKDSTQLTLGDFLMKRPKDSYFLNYYKRSRGLQFNNVRHKGAWRIKTQAEAALSRGRFSRNTIDGIEGNSGPYRLNGENGEQFIIIIAGTEKVFLDGKLLIRGEGDDYVIDYNSGEITFTPRILITRYSRIVVEFQYSDRNYARTVSHIGSRVSKGRVSVYANFFNEMDLKSQPFQQNLESDSSVSFTPLDAIAEAGDSVALYSNAREQDAFNPDRIMYIKKLVGAEEIFEYAALPIDGETYYQVVFSNVGFGKGAYNQAQTAANGKVFEYLGTGLGQYLPVEVLVAPKRLNTFSVGVALDDKGRKMGVEYAVSNSDQNTLSNKDDQDNTGFGLRVYRQSERLLKDSSKWTLKTDLNYELVSGQYNYIERYRNVEFDRRWNKVLANPNSFAELIPAYEHIGNASYSLRKSVSEGIDNRTSVFFRPGAFNGINNKTVAGFSWNKIDMSTVFEVMNSSTAMGDTAALENLFYSLNGQVSRNMKKMRVGFDFTLEQSAFETDTLESQSYGFKKYGVFLKSISGSPLKYSMKLAQREDRLPKNDGFNNSTLGRDLQVEGEYATKKGQRVMMSTIYRQLEILDESLSDKPLENTLQSRVELNLTFLKKFVRSRTFYELGTGQEQRREFQYLQVQAGNGIYVWNDYDTNGIKTLNEFEIASPLDKSRADYIKIYTPVAGFITTNRNKISQTIELQPAMLYKPQKRRKAFGSRFATLSTLILDKKVLPTNITDFLNPIPEDITDTNLISNSRSFRSTIFFNRGNPKYSIDYSYIDNESKVLLTNGFDSRASVDQVLNMRINLGRKFTFNTKAIFGNRLYVSEFFKDRSFDYNYIELEPKLQFVLKNTYRFELKTGYFTAENMQQYGGESAENINIGGEFKYTQAGKGTFNLAMNFIKIKFDGSGNSTLGYELLKGLQDGNNTTWDLGYQRTLSNNIQVILSYNGRDSETADVIHIGRLVARYLF